MRIGIVGGTFNPMHLGHLMLGEYAYKEFNLDEIWFMPNGNPPHKKLDKSTVSNENRVDMINLAINDCDYFKLCSHEINKDKISYSYQTMTELNEHSPENQYFFILGSDSLLCIESWMRPDVLLRTTNILVAIRESIDNTAIEEQIQYLTPKYNSNIKLLPMPILEISSSDIRRRITNGKTVKYVLPQAIQSYIEEHNLYI